MNQLPLPPQSERRALAIGRAVYEAFQDYHAQFSQITARARQRFETRDWSGAREDAVARIALYDHYISECMLRLRAVLLGQAHDRALWMRARTHYAELLTGLIDQELYKTFYNTLTRRYFRTQGVDAQIEFIALDIEPTDAITVPVARHTYAVSPGRLTEMLVRVLGDYPFEVPYAHGPAARRQSQYGCWTTLPIGASTRCAASNCWKRCSIANVVRIWSGACSANIGFRRV